MRHKSPLNEPENRLLTTPRPKSLPSQPLAMSHDETFMSHRETSDAAGNSPEKSKACPENRKSVRKFANWPEIASPPPRRACDSGAFPRSSCGKSPSARLGREPIFRAVARRRRRSWPESQGFCGSRPRSTCRRAAPEIPPAFSSLAPGARSGPRRRCPTWDIYVPSSNPVLTRRTRASPIGEPCVRHGRAQAMPEPCLLALPWKQFALLQRVGRTAPVRHDDPPENRQPAAEMPESRAWPFRRSTITARSRQVAE